MDYWSVKGIRVKLALLKLKLDRLKKEEKELKW